MAEQYYELLGVSSDATGDEIKSAYRDRLKETHPDVSDEADARSRTKRLIDAKEVLTDEDERARYDRLGHEQYVRIENGESVDGTEETVTGESAAAGPSATARGTGRGAGSTATASASGGMDGTATGAGTGRAARTGTDIGPEDIPWEDISAESVEGISDEVWEEITSESGGTTSGAAGSRRRGASAGAAASGQASTTTRRNRNPGNASVGWYQADGDPSGSGHNSWSFGGESVRDSPWPSWADPDDYTVSGNTPRVFGGAQRRVIIGMTLLLYPMLLAGTAFPRFGAAVRVMSGLCLVLLMMSLLVSPRYGMFVFGGWSVLFVPLLTIAGVLATPAGFGVLAVTVSGFGMSIFSLKVIRRALHRHG